MSNKQIQIIEEIDNIISKVIAPPYLKTELVKKIKTLVVQVQQQSKQETEKAFGGCKKCYGKGYSTEHTGEARAKPDFIGDKEHIVEPAKIRINWCSCDRGRQLIKLLKI